MLIIACICCCQPHVIKIINLFSIALPPWGKGNFPWQRLLVYKCRNSLLLLPVVSCKLSLKSFLFHELCFQYHNIDIERLMNGLGRSRISPNDTNNIDCNSSALITNDLQFCNQNYVNFLNLFAMHRPNTISCVGIFIIFTSRLSQRCLLWCTVSSIHLFYWNFC